MRIIKVGIMTKEQMKEYTLSIAKGDLKPGPDAPKIFFPSMRAMAESLNDNSKALMAAINQHHPESAKELAVLVNKDTGNVCRTLKRLECYGLIKMEKREGTRAKKPIALADGIEMSMSFSDMPLAI